MTWDGDISQMGQLEDRLRDLAEVPSRASRRASRDIEALIEDEFDAGADPYGNAWKELAPATLGKGRTPPPLTDTGTMRDSVHVRPMAGAGVAITIKNPPAAPHQIGWSGKQGSGPARPILPDRSELPPLWDEVIAAAVGKEMRV